MTFYDFIKNNWDVILILTAILVMITTTVHLTNKQRVNMVIIVALLAVLTVATYVENYLGNEETYSIWRAYLSSVKYIIPSLLLAFVPFTFMNNVKAWFFIPAAINAVMSIVSIWTGVIFSFHTDANSFQRGPLGYFPFFIAIVYICCIILMMLRQSHSGFADILPAVFFVFSSITNVFMPLWMLFDFESLFCISIAINVLLFYIYVIQQLTKKDPLTGLLNRQSYYNDIANTVDDVEAIVSIDMNGLKATNDSDGHAAGDLALKTLADCFIHAVTYGQRVYRVGGDEFMIVCFRGDEEAVRALISRIDMYVSKTKYTVAMGYAMKSSEMSVEDAAAIADERMYEAKNLYYSEKVHDRRKE